MKNQKGLFYGLTAVAIAALIIGLNQLSQAAETTTTDATAQTWGNMAGRGQGRMMTENGERPFRGQMTEADRAEFEAKRAEFAAEREARQTAVQAALEANSYEAWLAASGDDCPMADKITKENFAQFAKAHQLRQSADDIMTELGIERGGRGFGQMKGRLQ